MTIIRVDSRERDRFVIIDKSGLEDPRLSLRAKGLLAYLLSRPNDWTINSRQLADIGPDARTSVLAGLSELQRTGHLRRERRRAFNGRFEWEQVLYERADQLRLPTLDPLTDGDHGAVFHPRKTGPSTEEGSTEETPPKSSASGGRDETRKPSRTAVRLVPCPNCGADSGAKCWGRDRGYRRESNHRERVDAYLEAFVHQPARERRAQKERIESCTTCNGTGMVEVGEDFGRCPDCRSEVAR